MTRPPRSTGPIGFTNSPTTVPQGLVKSKATARLEAAAEAAATSPQMLNVSRRGRSVTRGGMCWHPIYRRAVNEGSRYRLGVAKQGKLEMDHSESKKIHDLLGMAGFRSLAIAAGFFQMLRELKAVGVLSEDAIERITESMLSELLENVPRGRVGDHVYEEHLRHRLRELFAGPSL